jgi:heparanase 1
MKQVCQNSPMKVRHHARLVAVLVTMVLASASIAAQTMEVIPSQLKAVATTDARYQSYNIEMAEVIGGRFWKPYAHSDGSMPPSGSVEIGGKNPLFEERVPVDLSSTRLRLLAAALGPAYLRVSGTWANSVYFQDDDAPARASPPEGFRGVLTRAQWRGVVEFAKAVDAQLVTSFTISPGGRDSSGAWTPLEAKPLIDFTHSLGGEIVAAELFNEPNVPSHGSAPPKYDAAWFARDEAGFRAFIASEAPKMRIVGPGDAVVANFEIPGSLKARDLLTSQPVPSFDIFSYHFYGAVSQRCAPAGSPMGTTAEKVLSDDWLARTDKAFDTHKELRDLYAPGKPIWVTETAEAACGGDPWAVTFADSFRYIDQLARLAKRGASAVFHNTLAASEYGLIDQTTLEPRPNYWAALLWRNLMGSVVLDTIATQPGVHLYAHCLRDHPGGVALLVLNLSDVPAALAINGARGSSYALTAASLRNQSVLLNGRPLAVAVDGKPPELKGKRIWRGRANVAPRSIEFISVPGARNANCQ